MTCEYLLCSVSAYCATWVLTVQREYLLCNVSAYCATWVLTVQREYLLCNVSTYCAKWVLTVQRECLLWNVRLARSPHMQSSGQMQFVNVKSRGSRSFCRSLQRLGITCQWKMSWWTATELKLIICTVLKSLKSNISLSQERKLNVESFCYTSASFAVSVCIWLHVISCVNVSPLCSIPQVCGPHRLLNPV